MLSIKLNFLTALLLSTITVSEYKPEDPDFCLDCCEFTDSPFYIVEQNSDYDLEQPYMIEFFTTTNFREM